MISTLLQHHAIPYGAFHQSSFGTTFPKPTRILYRLSGVLEPRILLGEPKFDEQGFYLGPLSRCKHSSNTLARQPGDKTFRTSGAAAWPPLFCEWVVDELLEEARSIADDRKPVESLVHPRVPATLYEEVLSENQDWKSSVIFNLGGQT
jgi:hypothetical protein